MLLFWIVSIAVCTALLFVFTRNLLERHSVSSKKFTLQFSNILSVGLGSVFLYGVLALEQALWIRPVYGGDLSGFFFSMYIFSMGFYAVCILTKVDQRLLFNRKIVDICHSSPLFRLKSQHVAAFLFVVVFILIHAMDEQVFYQPEQGVTIYYNFCLSSTVYTVQDVESISQNSYTSRYGVEHNDEFTVLLRDGKRITANKYSDAALAFQHDWDAANPS